VLLQKLTSKLNFTAMNTLLPALTTFDLLLPNIAIDERSLLICLQQLQKRFQYIIVPYSIPGFAPIT
jgi:hypothetical protein